MSYVPSGYEDAVINEQAFPQSTPTDSIIFLAQLEKAQGEITDDDAKAMANRSLKYYKYALRILNHKGNLSDQADNDAIRMMQQKYGTNLDGVLRLAEFLRETDQVRQANETVQKVLDKVGVDAGGGGTSIVKDMQGSSIFGYAKK